LWRRPTEADIHKEVGAPFLCRILFRLLLALPRNPIPERSGM
jgi:hypothetical protein